MDTAEDIDQYRRYIREIMIEYCKIPYAHGDIQFETVFDSQADRYLLMILGREEGRRVHGCLIHIDIINGKLWIQRDGTEKGIANELADFGVPKQNIVLGFRSPEVRKYTEFAAA
ncbi:MAG: XisI protein [Desulfobacteraceae bacterium]|nr:XisI protein [Desulfobacteraceae bacterium]